LKKIVLFPFLSIWILFIAIGITGVYILFSEIFMPKIKEYLFVGYGFFTYLFTLIIISHKKYEFWNILKHEIAHAILVVLTFARPQKLVASVKSDDQGKLGYLRYNYKLSSISSLIRSHTVSLAPYFFPYLTIFLSIVYYIVKPDHNFFSNLFIDTSLNSLLFIMGFIYSYEIYTAIMQASPHQSDFSNLGYLYGLSFVIFMQVIFLIIMLLVIADDHNSFKVMSSGVIEIISSLIKGFK
jgi:hypothetical protein